MDGARFDARVHAAVKTQAFRAPPPTVRDEILLAEEVLLATHDPPQSHRVLLPFALAYAANAVRVNVPFELRRLDSSVLATYDGERLQARAEIEAVLPSLATFLDDLTSELTRELLARLAPPPGEPPST